MRNTWKAVLVASSLVGPVALASWESPVAITASDDWETPVAVLSEDDWETPSTSCLKAVAVNVRTKASRAAMPVQGFLNACGEGGTPRWQSAELMDPAWRDSYVSVQDGRSIYRVHVSQDAAGWHGLLYNFRLGRWEEKSFVSR
jgi:hypothetical protein